MISSATMGLRQPTCFRSDGVRLHGMLELPTRGCSQQDTGVLLLNSDDGCRLGPHRLWVLLAERLGHEGHPCLRFDYRGCGDSEGSESSLSADTALADVIAAESHLREQTGVRKTVLVGICYGGEIGLLACRCINSVAGLVALSMGRYVTTEGYTRAAGDAYGYLRSYRRKLFTWDAWRKILTGRVHTQIILDGLFHRLSPAAWQRDCKASAAAQARAAGEFRGIPNLFIYGTADPLWAKHMPEYQREAEGKRISRAFRVIRGADHNFSSAAWSAEAIEETVIFIRNLTTDGGRF